MKICHFQALKVLWGKFLGSFKIKFVLSGRLENCCNFTKSISSFFSRFFRESRKVKKFKFFPHKKKVKFCQNLKCLWRHIMVWKLTTFMCRKSNLLKINPFSLLSNKTKTKKKKKIDSRSREKSLKKIFY